MGVCIVISRKKRASSSGGRLAGGRPVVQEQKNERAGAEACWLADAQWNNNKISLSLSLSPFIRTFERDHEQQRTPINTYVRTHQETKAYR